MTKKKIKIVTAKKKKAPVKKSNKTKSVTAKKAKATVKAKAKKTKTIVKAKTKKVVSKPARPARKVKSIVKSKPKSATAKKAKAPVKSKIAKKIVIPETETNSVENQNNIPGAENHGKDLHLIPEKGEKQQLTTFDIHGTENKFQHLEGVKLNQENQKVKQALSSRKHLERFNRNRGRR